MALCHAATWVRNREFISIINSGILLVSLRSNNAIFHYRMNEFAVIQTGGKQYKVSKGDIVTIEKLSGEHKEGEKITFDKVLLIDNGKDTTIGTPYIKGAQVTATLKEEGRDRKISVIRFRAKSRYFKKRGHRQPYFKVHIDSLK